MRTAAFKSTCFSLLDLGLGGGQGFVDDLEDVLGHLGVDVALE